MDCGKLKKMYIEYNGFPVYFVSSEISGTFRFIQKRSSLGMWQDYAIFGCGTLYISIPSGSVINQQEFPEEIELQNGQPSGKSVNDISIL